MSKNRLLNWVDDQTDLDVVSKFILDKLARYADADGCAWAKVSTLAALVNVSERTVQARLRLLEERGLMVASGLMHRLEHSTRSVPIYQLAPDVEGLGLRLEPGSMGANPAPIEGEYGCKNGGGMGAAACTPKNQGYQERSNDLSEARAGEGSPAGQGDGPDTAALEAGFAAMERAYPKAGLGVSDRSMGWRAFVDLVRSGAATAEQLIGAAGRFAADPMLKRRDYGPVSIQRWLAEGRYRAWVDEGPAPVVAAAAVVGGPFEGPADVAQAVAAILGEGDAAKWLGMARWDGEGRRLVARTGYAARQLERAAGRLARLDVTISVVETA